MTESTLPGRTERETSEYHRDRGRRVTAAQAYHYIGRLIETDDDYPLPDGAAAVIAAAAAAMQDIAARREASAEAYAAERREAIRAAATETHAAIFAGSAACPGQNVPARPSG